MTPADIAKLDQSIAQLRSTVPAMLWGFYRGCIDSGFSTSQAMQLTLAWMTTLSAPPKEPLQPPSDV